MDDKRNIIMAVLLTGIILFGWPMLMEQFFPDMANKNEIVEQADVPATDQVPGESMTPVVGSDTGSSDISTGAVSDKIRPLAFRLPGPRTPISAASAGRVAAFLSPTTIQSGRPTRAN